MEQIISRLAAVLSAICLMSIGGVANAQSVEDQLSNIESQVSEQASQKGVSLVKVFNRKWYLGAGDEVDIDLEELDGFQNYLVIGVCDIDCSGLGLTIESAVLTAPDEIEIEAQDISGTDMPMLEFFMVPLVSRYNLNVSMLECTTTICEYGIDIYRLDK